MTEFNHWISNIRKTRNLQNVDICYMCDLSCKTLSDYSTGKATPNLIALVKLREGLELDDKAFMAMLDALTADAIESGKIDKVLFNLS